MPRLYVAVTAMFFVAEAHGQIATTTSLVGNVADATGKTVAGSRVSAVNRDSGDTYSVLTNETGNYNIQFVRVGTYNLSVEKSGFQRLEKTGIVVENNGLVLKRLKSKPQKLEPTLEDYFQGPDGHIHFQRDRSSTVTGFVLNSGRIKNFHFRKTAQS